MAQGQGMAILSGLLHGLGGIGAVETRRREAERAAAEQEKDRRSKLISLPHAQLPAMFQASFTPDAAGNVQMPLSVLPLIHVFGKEEEAKREDAAAWEEIEAARRGRDAGSRPVSSSTPEWRHLTGTPEAEVVEPNRAGVVQQTPREMVPAVGSDLSYRPTLAVPGATGSAAGAARATSPRSDAQLVLEILGRRRRLTPSAYLERQAALDEQEAKREASQRPKFSPHLIEDVEGQRLVPFTTEGTGAGTVGPPQRVGGQKPREPRAATEYDKKMDTIKTAMLALHRMDPKTHPAPGTDDWDVKLGDLAARMGIPLEGSVAGLVSGRTIAGTAPGNVAISPPAAASIEAPLGTTREQAAAAQRVPMTAEQQNKQAAMRGASAILDKLKIDVEKIFSDDPTSVLGRLANIPRASWRVWLQADPTAATYHAQRKVLAFNLARASGSVGATTDEDARRVDASLPIVWPIPDSPAVAAKKMRDLPAVLREIADRAAGRTPTQGPAESRGPIVMPQPPAGTPADRNLVIEKDGQQYVLPKGTRMPQGATVIRAQ